MERTEENSISLCCRPRYQIKSQICNNTLCHLTASLPSVECCSFDCRSAIYSVNYNLKDLIDFFQRLGNYCFMIRIMIMCHSAAANMKEEKYFLYFYVSSCDCVCVCVCVPLRSCSILLKTNKYFRIGDNKQHVKFPLKCILSDAQSAILFG